MNYTRYLAEPADITNVEVQHRATFCKTLNFLFSPPLICCWSRMPCTALSLSGAHVCGHDLNIGHLTRPRPKIGPICFCILFVFVFARSQYQASNKVQALNFQASPQDQPNLYLYFKRHTMITA